MDRRGVAGRQIGSLRGYSGEKCCRRHQRKILNELRNSSRPHADVLDRQIEQFQRSIVIGKAAAGFNDLAQQTVERLYRIRRVVDGAKARNGVTWSQALRPMGPIAE